MSGAGKFNLIVFGIGLAVMIMSGVLSCVFDVRGAMHPLFDFVGSMLTIGLLIFCLGVVIFVLRRVIRKIGGNEPCPHQHLIPSSSTVYETLDLTPWAKHQCPECWQELEKLAEEEDESGKD